MRGNKYTIPNRDLINQNDLNKKTGNIAATILLVFCFGTKIEDHKFIDGLHICQPL